MKNKLMLMVAILVGILAFWLSADYMKKEKARLYDGAVKVNVIVAKRDLPAMTVLTIDDLILRKEFKSAVGSDAFFEEDLNKILGKRLKYTVKAEKMILWSYVDIQRDIQTGLAPIIGREKRALSIAISGAAAVSGLVKPNDHVDIIGTFTTPSRTNPQQMEQVTMTLMQNVTVLATGMNLARQNTESGQTQPAGYSTVTFELSPDEVEILVFAQQTRGQLYLSLRNPDDISRKVDLPSINFDYIEAELRAINERRQQDVLRGTGRPLLEME